jgi:site-specific recombinase XerD
MSRQPGDAKQPRLLDQLREQLAVRHRSPRTVEAYVGWVRRYLRFHGLRHPSLLGPGEVSAFLSHLAIADRVSASTQNQALAALLFLYDKVLGAKLPEMEIARARRPTRLPTVMSRDEVRGLLSKLEGVPRLMASLLYGAGFDCRSA